MNVFQNLQEGSDIFFNDFGKSYKDWIKVNEFERLNLLFHRRHLLSHTEGIVDKKYLDKTKDDKYKEGQRVVVKREDVLSMSDILIKLTNQISLILN